MEGQPSLLLDLAVALSIALVGGWVATRVGLSSIIGYMAAGLIISPFTPGFVGDVDRLRLIAEIGIVLLMFSIGVHFSLRELAATRPLIIAAATAQVAGVMAGGFLIGTAAGWGSDQSLFAGAALAISSSTVVVKILSDGEELDAAHGRLAITWSIVEDLCAVIIVAVLIALTGGDDLAASVGMAGVKALVFVAAVLVIGVPIVPRLLARVSAVASRELFVLGIAALALGMALASEKVGLSVAFGAFLAGMLVSDTDLSDRIQEELLPARDVFGALFFVSVGMLIDPDVLRDNVPLLASLLLLIVVGKGLLTLGLARLVGISLAVALPLSALLSQAGEFSFVLVGIGVDRDVVQSDVFSLVVAATAMSMALTPVITAMVARLARRSRVRSRVESAAPP